MNRLLFCNFGEEDDFVGETALKVGGVPTVGESRGFSPVAIAALAALTARSVDLDFAPEILTLKLLHLGGRDLSEDLSLNTER